MFQSEFLGGSSNCCFQPIILIVSVFLSVIVLALLRSAFNNLVRSPLRHFPGPVPAKLSKLWILAIEFTGRRALYVHWLHQRYGPIVRVAPNELSFASSAAVRDIYVGVTVDSADADAHGASDDSTTSAQSSLPLPPLAPGKRVQQKAVTKSASAATKTFPKGDRYSITRRSIGALQDEAEHRASLKRLGHCFSAALLPDMELVVRAETALLLHAMEQRRGGEINMLHWFRLLSLDVTGQLFFGKSFGALTTKTQPKFLHYLDYVAHAWLLKAWFPIVFGLLRCLPVWSIQTFLASGDDFYEYGAAALREFVASHGRAPTCRLPLARLVIGNPAKGVPPLPDAQIANEISLIIAAGTDTTGTTLTHVFYELAQHPAWYDRLRAEVNIAAAAAAAAAASTSSTGLAGKNASCDATAVADEYLKPQDKTEEKVKDEPSSPPTSPLLPPYATLQGLPVLNAVIWETLRTHPSVPGALHREVPPGGAPVPGRAATGAGAGAWLPAGTNVSAQAYTVQRNPDVFPQPDVWEPARWLACAATTSVPLSSLSLRSSSFSAALGRDEPSALSRQTGRSVDAATAAMCPKHGRASAEHRDGSVGGSGDVAGYQKRAAGIEETRGGGGEAETSGCVAAGQFVAYEDDAMRAHMQAFSRGSRACLGKSIALVVMKLATAAVAQRFATVRLAHEQQTPDDMRMRDRFVLVPKGKRCRLVFG